MEISPVRDGSTGLLDDAFLTQDYVLAYFRTDLSKLDSATKLRVPNGEFGRDLRCAPRPSRILRWVPAISSQPDFPILSLAFVCPIKSRGTDCCIPLIWTVLTFRRSYRTKRRVLTQTLLAPATAKSARNWNWPSPC
jgi:hypothetical protein